MQFEHMNISRQRMEQLISSNMRHISMCSFGERFALHQVGPADSLTDSIMKC